MLKEIFILIALAMCLTRLHAQSSPSCPTFIRNQFRLGLSYDKSNNCAASTVGKYDYLTIWMNTIDENGSTQFNHWYQGAMIDCCVRNNKIPLFYAYVIAFEARRMVGLQDCDVDANWNLCRYGAQFIRDNRQYLVNQYDYQAREIASRLGRDRTAIFVMEPDFWQYYGDDGTNGKPSQQGGVLSGAYARALFDDFVRVIKNHLPNALISWDISAWIGQDGFRTWWSFFSNADIQFIHTSGGQARGDMANIKPNELTWNFVSSTTGRKIIADCGYGVGGELAWTCWAWEDQYGHQNNRIADGVVSLSVGNPTSGNYGKPYVNC